MPVRQDICPKCGKKVGAGQGVVVHWGAGGKVHKTCLPDKTVLANGETFVRKTDNAR
jgi:hypothetical protein